MIFWKLLYDLVAVPLMWIGFRIAGLFNNKIKTGIRGRKSLLGNMASKVAALQGSHCVWFHSSSMGEFEQAKPIIASLKKRYPSVNIIVTFFSPSGYEHSQSYKPADVISYLPFDSPGKAKKFIEIVRPTAAVMVRYDVWPNLLWALHEAHIPTFIANATMSARSLRKLPVLLQFHRSLYNCINYILTVSDLDIRSFSSYGLHGPVLARIGDTRFDQVVTRSLDAGKRHILSDSIVTNKKVLIIAQSWEEDEKVVLPALLKLHDEMKHLLTIVVPHEPTVQHLEQLEFELEGRASFIKLSEVNDYRDEKIIIVDSVGALMQLYRYAHVAFVGGSFRQGVHNVLEPAVYSLPVVFGPKHSNSQEAVLLAQCGGGVVVEDENQLHTVLRLLLENESERKAKGNKARIFVDENTGATERFLKYLTPLLA
jgi:3-deoxy-D-manno-octulosonic-acid transferase